MSDIRRVLDWLAGGAFSGEQSQDVLAELCERMLACGIPLWRAAVFVTTLHPDVMGRRFLWQAESGVTTSKRYMTSSRRTNLCGALSTQCTRLARRCGSVLGIMIDAIEFKVLRDLRDQGGTDYAAFPLLFTDGSIHVATFATREPGGFSAAQFFHIIR